MLPGMTPGQALQLWRQVMFGIVTGKQPDLSPRQMAVLLTIYMEPPPHTVRGLAKRLGVTKPVITRALDTMGKLDLVARRRDETDRRNVVIMRTVRGSQHIDALAMLISQAAGEIRL